MKKWNIVYSGLKTTAYSKLKNAFVFAASMNKVANFTPVLAPNGTVDMGAASAEYILQEGIRVKAKDVTYTGKPSVKEADDALDTFTQIEWKTHSVATGKLKGIGVKTGINEKFNIESIGSVHEKVIADSYNVRVIERNEKLLDATITGATNVQALTANDLFTQLSNEAGKIMLKSSDTKHMTDPENMLIIMHPFLATKVAKEKGTDWNNEAPIYDTGLKSKNSIGGIPVIVDATLNAFQKGGVAAENSVAAVILDIETVAFKAADETVPVSVDKGLYQFNGVFYYSIEKLIDESRVTIATMDLGVAITPKVSD